MLTIAPWVSRGSTKLSAEVLVVAPGTEPETIAGLAGSELLRQPGAVIIVGERLASAPGALSAAAQLADKTGAALRGFRAGRASAGPWRPGHCRACCRAHIR